MAEKTDKKFSELDSPKKEKRPRRGTETMFRITATNQMRLSDMADNKAHILLTINSIIVSIVVSLLLRKLGTEPNLLIPTICFLITCLVTIVSAILVTMPRISKATFSREDILDKKVNLLFFGNYHSMRYEDYEEGIKTMMQDPDYLYTSLIKDNFSLGLVLESKYRRLRFSYMFFMIGFIISVLTFVVAEIMSTPL
ncbi:Pycsar system effector family protein [Nibribacter koreensis]|uniref:Pycsar effector protein domain-containing protein n=1 Tax=Nibribacter koreensis TaxID=1084519 RepID=A0ABP8FZI9_9BACT